MPNRYRTAIKAQQIACSSEITNLGTDTPTILTLSNAKSRIG